MSEIILSLFKKRKQLISLLSSTADKGKKALNMCRPITNLESAVKIFKQLFTEEDMPEPMRDLRSDIDFVHFIVAGTSDSLKFASIHTMIVVFTIDINNRT